ncbi:MAG: hypothetical protein KA765_17835, partial [Thermoflexales bacterium]|nr:hypothetical protein [Thermoflexales bacterium]
MRLRVMLALVGSLVVLVVSLALLQHRVLASPLATTWYVSPTGSDGNTCQAPGAACATIGAAVGKAFSGDTIEIAAGTYVEHDVQIDKPLTLNGAGANTTFVDGNTAGRVFYVTSAVTMT